MTSQSSTTSGNPDVDLTEGAFARRLVEATPHTVYVFDVNLQRTLYVSPQLERDLGLEPGALAEMGSGFMLKLLHPDDIARLSTLLERWPHIRDHEVVETEYRMRHADGTWRWFLARDVVLQRTPAGAVELILGTAQDMTERHEIHERHRRLVHELDHRVHNTVQAITALAISTIGESTTLDEFGERFIGRLTSLGRAHSALSESRWTGLDLLTAVRAPLEPYVESKVHDVELTGPDQRIDARAATPLALALHELTTNAVKHGALRPEGGALRVVWRIDDGRLTLDWKETLPEPRDMPAAPHGVGLNLIRGFVEHELRGTFTCDALPGGFEARFEIQLAPP